MRTHTHTPCIHTCELPVCAGDLITCSLRHNQDPDTSGRKVLEPRGRKRRTSLTTHSHNSSHSLPTRTQSWKATCVVLFVTGRGEKRRKLTRASKTRDDSSSCCFHNQHNCPLCVSVCLCVFICSFFFVQSYTALSAALTLPSIHKGNISPLSSSLLQTTGDLGRQRYGTAIYWAGGERHADCSMFDCDFAQ